MKKPEISRRKTKTHTDDDKFGIKWFYNLNMYYMKTFLMDARHNNTMNMAYMDGHVGNYKPEFPLNYKAEFWGYTDRPQ